MNADLGDQESGRSDRNLDKNAYLWHK